MYNIIIIIENIYNMHNREIIHDIMKSLKFEKFSSFQILKLFAIWFEIVKMVKFKVLFLKLIIFFKNNLQKYCNKYEFIFISLIFHLFEFLFKVLIHLNHLNKFQ